MITDTIFLMHVGEIELGASTLAGIWHLAIYMLGFGLSLGLQVVITILVHQIIISVIFNKLRYFQPDSKGKQEINNGTVFPLNNLYQRIKEIFRLYYTSVLTNQQTTDIYIIDNFGRCSRFRSRSTMIIANEYYFILIQEKYRFYKL